VRKAEKVNFAIKEQSNNMFDHDADLGMFAEAPDSRQKGKRSKSNKIGLDLQGDKDLKKYNQAISEARK
jgi:hypothetical protein